MNSSEMKTFESNTKVMLSGEYLVLKGALSLALPLKFKQILTVHESFGTPSVKWKSMINADLWFYTTLLLPDFKVSETNNSNLTETLSKILKAARILNPEFLVKHMEYLVNSSMDFNPEWGIGSSSSLISNIAYWANCDPFELNNLIFNGSGYDIACARSYLPIIYDFSENKPHYRNSDFNPPFHKQLYFIYLNYKQNTLESVKKMDLFNISSKDISAISEVTLALEEARNLEIFQMLMDQHEDAISDIIQIKPFKSLYFNDFNGSIKSLGAWGGDFILAASGSSEEYVRNYFIKKNLNIIFRYDEIVRFND